jgi:three-Cys-motif partner protein
MCELTETEIEQYLKDDLSKDEKKRIRNLLLTNPECRKKAEKIKKKIKKEEAKNKMLPHSIAKVEMFSIYLSRYLSILTLVPFVDQINIFDMFCGRGFYENDEEGSPIKAFKVIRDVQLRLIQQGKPLKEVTITINDEETKFVEKISEFIEKENQPKVFKILPNYLTLKVVELFPRIISQLSNQEGKQKNLIFIDPYGYKEIHKKDIQNLLKNGNTEIVLFLPISQMNRFKEYALKDRANESHQRLREFIEEFFEKNNPIITGEKKTTVYEFIDFIRVALSFNGNFYSTSYFIERDENKNVYALFFITPNEIGFEKILESKWKLDSLQGRGFRLSETGNFFKKAHINNFENKLESFLKSGTRNNIEVYKFALENEHLKTHVGDVFRNWKVKKRLEVYDYETQKLNNRGFYIEGKNLKVYYKLK